ncbi:hypothetical protein [Methanohalobium sp.]|uniref:hypothetical protein n=1 Tax=Methanohalobium sp. TaxID=2837493 RepID=UPI0025D44822|nr:hypothetical protein [Methanohalobium sp.]
MPKDLYKKINEILDGRQLSISGITRELKNEGYDEHRLFLTGYLRALKDMDKLVEIEVPPSKIYRLMDDSDETSEDVYSLLCDHLKQLDFDYRVPVGIYIAFNLFERPVFRQELKLIGFSEKQIQNQVDDFANIVQESTDTNLKKYRSDITRIDIPSGDRAYEIKSDDENIIQMSNEILIELMKEFVDIRGLVPKTKQTKLSF